MRRHRVVLLVGIVVVIVVVCCLRPFGDDDDSDPPGGDPAGDRPPADAPPGAPPRWPDPVDSSAPASPQPSFYVPGADSPIDGLIAGGEEIDPALAPAAVAAAERFADRWADPETTWPDGVVELATPALADALATSPTPPAVGRVTGDGYLLLDAPQWARVAVPVDDGTVVIDVIDVDGQWLASALAWWPQEQP